MAQVVVGTGAGAGVGRATADVFAKAGYDVALLSHESQRLERAAAELGPIAIWANVAMATEFAPVSKLTAAEVPPISTHHRTCSSPCRAPTMPMGASTRHPVAMAIGRSSPLALAAGLYGLHRLAKRLDV